MAQREKNKELVAEFEKPRIYTDPELKDFHQKIQRFKGPEREVILARGMSGIAQKFDYDAMAVAFGAAVRVSHGTSHVHLYNDRYGVLANLWRQYEGWRGKQDWIAEKELERLGAVEAEGIPF